VIFNEAAPAVPAANPSETPATGISRAAKVINIRRTNSPFS
jgi:hypothetical protein